MSQTDGHANIEIRSLLFDDVNFEREKLIKPGNYETIRKQKNELETHVYNRVIIMRRKIFKFGGKY